MPYSDKEHRRFLPKILTHLKNYSGEKANPFSLFSFFEWQERQSKFLINSVRSYEFYGFDWWLPLWDAEFMEFWREVPLLLRQGKGWYASYVAELGAEHEPRMDRNASDRIAILAMLKRIAGRKALKALFPYWQELKARQHVCMPYDRFDRKMLKSLNKKGYRVNGVEAYYFINEVAREGLS